MAPSQPVAYPAVCADGMEVGWNLQPVADPHHHASDDVLLHIWLVQ